MSNRVLSPLPTHSDESLLPTLKQELLARKKQRDALDLVMRDFTPRLFDAFEESIRQATELGAPNFGKPRRIAHPAGDWRQALQIYIEDWSVIFVPLVGSAWPPFFNKAIAEAQHKNIEAVGMPKWSDADQTLAKALQKEIGAKVEGLKEKVEPLSEPAKDPVGGGSDDVGDISWNVPMVYLMYPANIPNLPGHNWANGVAMATPIAHKGSTAGAKVQAMTALDFLLQPELVKKAWDYFRDVQTKGVHYETFLAPDDKPAIEMNREKMEKFAPELKKFYFDPLRYKTYLEQLGIHYPTIKAVP